MTEADHRKIAYHLEHISKVFPGTEQEIVAVNDISLDIFEGEVFGVIGMSGAGKSTLVRTLNRLEDVTSGTVQFYGQDIGTLKPKELSEIRQSIAMIFQHFNLLNQKTVLENVRIPLKISKAGRKEQKETAMEMLRVVGLADKANAYPAQLSGGQKQRVAIARALSIHPRVLLCDEATSALDPKITDELLSLLKEINRKMNLTIVIITHEMSVVEKICDRVAIIDKGSLAELGDVRSIFTNPQSDAAKRMVLPADSAGDNPYDATHTDSRLFRIVFDGRAASEPLIANLVEETGKKVNILSANTRSVGGIGFGQMIVEMPRDRKDQKVVLDYLTRHGVAMTEVKQHDRS